MSSFSIQFHATPAELRQFVARGLSAYRFMRPRSRISHTALPHSTLSRWTAPSRRPRRIVLASRPLALASRPLALDVSGNTRLLDRNPGVSIMELGALTEKGLDESQCSTKDASETWKAIYRDVEKDTAAGATAVNEASGATAPARSHRYTPGAKALWKAQSC
jgi:hypothetical protein